MRPAIRITILVIIIIAGLAVLFYPDISNWHNSRVHAELLFSHNEELARMHEEYIQDHWQRAHAFNERLNQITVRDAFDGYGAVIKRDEYEAILNIGGVMALVEIPAINVRLPVFHTTSHETLLRGVGHLENTSLPVGGASTHSVLTAHSGLAAHRLFTDLEELGIGQLFFVQVLGETLAYQVDQRRVVLPHEIDDIRIIPGADHVTLITCTPYAINSHRLLVRGIRTPYEPGMEELIESILPEEIVALDIRIIIITAILCLFLLVLFVRLLIGLKKRKSVTERV